MAANINVKNFTLTQGQWLQTSTTPTFNVSNNFQIAITGTSGTTYNGFYGQFTRLNGTAVVNSLTANLVTDVYGLQGIATGPLTSTTNYALSAALTGNIIDVSITINWTGTALQDLEP